MTTLEARIAEVVAEADSAHAFRAANYSDRERPTFRCACGVATIGMHHEHHREALTDALLPMIREAQAEALREAVSDFEDNVGIGEFAEQSRRATRGGWAHIDEAWESQGPYMDWLRNRADSLEAS